MAANYWNSTQRRHWQTTKDELAAMRQRLEVDNQALVEMLPLPRQTHLSIYINQQLNRLGKRLGSRQQAIATAQIYIKRFYTKVEIRRTNPILVIVTALYLASKMEESPQHIRIVAQEAGRDWDASFLEPSRLGECEFHIISELNSQMIVHQPYRTLTSLQSEFNLSQEESALAWTVINDHYMTDLPLLYPPHVIALTAIMLAVVLRASPPTTQQQQGAGTATGAASAGAVQTGLAAASAALAQAQVRAQQLPTAAGPHAGKDGSKVPDPRTIRLQKLVTWLADSNIHIEAMVGCTQEMISFYESQESYNDKLTRDQIQRIIKVRGFDK